VTEAAFGRAMPRTTAGVQIKDPLLDDRAALLGGGAVLAHDLAAVA